ncbi:MAG: tetratricopeptide repeat protein [Spirochaetes bacterium]|jgi:tetratricopeptide (TPR) repeat protein|nr:tetratricopeptide repeat protein [Spirochaetota bacterium]
MRRFCALVVVLAVFAQGAFAQVSSLLEEADELYDAERYERSVEVLERARSDASSDRQRAEVYWRLARTQLSIGDELRDEKGDDDAAMEVYDRGMEYADQAIDYDPSNNEGYYWKASNLGRWGETRGILSSLRQAGPMRDLLEQSIERNPDHAESYYVLGLLYARVPGGLISFGNTDYAVSLGRKAVDLHLADVRRGDEELYYPIRFELASHLLDRGWNRRKRGREQEAKRSEHAAADGILEQSFYYEGTVNIPPVDDEEEAKRILEDVIDELAEQAEPGSRKARQLERARELLGGI